MPHTVLDQDEAKITQVSGKGPDFWCTLAHLIEHSYGITVTYYPNPWNQHSNFHFNLVYLDVLLMAAFIREESGAFTLDHYLCCGISLDPSWPTVYAKKRQFVTCLQGSRFIPLREQPASLPHMERKLLGLESMWFGSVWCEHVSASNQCWVPGLHTYQHDSLMVIVSLAGPASKEPCLWFEGEWPIENTTRKISWHHFV